MNKLLNKYFASNGKWVALVLPVVFVISVLLSISGGTVSATTSVYQTAKNGACSQGDIYLDVNPYTKDGKQYYCVQYTNSADAKLVSGGGCRAGAPEGNALGGVYCFPNTPTIKPDGIQRAADPFADSGPSNSAFADDINGIANFLAVGVGVIVTIMIVVGGIQYAASGGDPQAVASAKKKIYNALLALLAFALVYAFLQFIVPGGTF
jgi:hypothetical protein